MTRKLTKSKSNVVLTGALAGIAEYIGIDPTIARILFIFATIGLQGSPIFIYLLFAVLMPKADVNHGRYRTPYDRPQPSKARKNSKKAARVEDGEWSDF
ncbi:PspC family transcriptional regulator [Enterococcus florum]|uniref:PspC family transcriptional regulator n=1 Tax=Enterococcus florum TaxID=2480627 RepID=A0A4V0WPE5_9ENTE|nr:PspC domain-containing protein [Enterococcus florum]GCF93579.1 PspC family transcriptional regulator [Enterococcus florum]